MSLKRSDVGVLSGWQIGIGWRGGNTSGVVADGHYRVVAVQEGVGQSVQIQPLEFVVSVQGVVEIEPVYVDCRPRMICHCQFPQPRKGNGPRRSRAARLPKQSGAVGSNMGGTGVDGQVS